jgi:hypothetical protein
MAAVHDEVEWIADCGEGRNSEISYLCSESWNS